MLEKNLFSSSAFSELFVVVVPSALIRFDTSHLVFNFEFAYFNNALGLGFRNDEEWSVFEFIKGTDDE